MRGRAEKRERVQKKRCAGKGRKYFQMCWGRFSTVLCVENLPQHLKRWGEGKKKEERGRKKRERGRKKMCREEKKIFSKVLGKVFNNVMPWNLPQHLEKWREGKKKKMHRVGNDDLLFWKCFSFSKFFSLSDNLYFSKCFSFRGQPPWILLLAGTK